MLRGRVMLLQIASMGPRSVERGKLSTTSLGRYSQTKLQWGRVLLNAESVFIALTGDGTSGFNGAAFC